MSNIDKFVSIIEEIGKKKDVYNNPLTWKERFGDFERLDDIYIELNDKEKITAHQCLQNLQ